MTLHASLHNRLRLPLVAAPMFLASGPDLVLACCGAGIIGTFPAKNQRSLDGFDSWLATIGQGLDAMRADGGTPPPYGVNLIVHRTNKVLDGELELCVKHKVPIVITSLGAVPALVDSVHDYGGLVFHDVINLRHARKAAGAGVDGLIAVAAGAGGHTGRTSPFGLVNEIRSFFDGTVLLSGAMSSGSDIAAAQMMGADLAYLGTRFIGTRECQSPDDYKQMLVEASASDIVETDAVTGINANFIQASLDRAGFDLDADPGHGQMDIDKELAEALSDRSNESRPWRDIWSAGHGVGGVDGTPGVDELVERIELEYTEAWASREARLELLRGAGVAQ